MKKILTIATLMAGLSTSASWAETLKVTTFLPPMHTFTKAVTAWGEELTEKSNGELEFQMFPASQLGPPPRQFDVVRSGGADIAIFLHGATPGRFAMTDLATLPLTYPSAGQESAVTSRRLTELAPEFLAEEHAGTRILWMAVTPPLMVHLADTDPSDLSNLEGKRIRYAGTTWQKVIETLGASPVPVPPAETADALAKGVVDGATFPFEATKAFDLGTVTKYTLAPGIASATFAVVMSDAAYDRLSPDMQALVDETTGPDRAAWFGGLWDKGEEVGRAYLEESGVQIVTMDDATLEGLSADLSGISEEAIANKGDAGAAFVAAYTK